MNAWERALAKTWPPELAAIQRLPWDDYIPHAKGRCPGCGEVSLLSPEAVLTQHGPPCDWAWLGPNGDGRGRPRSQPVELDPDTSGEGWA